MCHAIVHFMNPAFDVLHAHDWLAALALITLKRNHARSCLFMVHSNKSGRCGIDILHGQYTCIRAIGTDAIATADLVISVSGVFGNEI